MTEVQIPEFIEVLLRPATPKATGRKVWSLDLETVLLPFFFATNAMQKTAIPSEALGAPTRLAYDKDGQAKFSDRTGKPVIRVTKEISGQVKLMRENYAANLVHFAQTVRKANPEGYADEVKTALKAGEPIREADKLAIEKAIAEAMAEAMAKKSEPQAVTV